MSHPAGIAIDQDGTFAYVSNAALDSVSVINTGSNTVVGDPIRVGRDPVAIAILRHSNFINPLTAVWKGGSVFNMQGLLTTFTAPVDNPSLVASVTWDFYGDDSVVQTTATTSTQFTYTRAGLFRPTVTVTLTDGTRASAITTMRVQSPAEAIATTVSLVNWLDLPAGATTSLVVQLDGASDAVTRGNIYAACGELHAFENEVQALVQSSRLDQSGAAPRLGEAQAIRFSLGCS
jgi:YVTN family beta-propeller protein